MDGLVYTAASGATRIMRAQQIRAENLGNSDKAGFRTQMERAEAFVVGGSGFKGRSFVNTKPAGIDLTPAALNKTERPLDMAIQGPGLMTIQKEDGTEAYTRNGSFKVDQERNLHLNGLPVIGLRGAIKIPDYQSIEVSKKGLISIVPRGGGIQKIDTLKLVDPTSEELTKDEFGLIVHIDGEEIEASEKVRVAQGFMEESNVSAVTELTDVMALTRNFEMQIKMMKTAEEIAKVGNSLIAER